MRKLTKVRKSKTLYGEEVEDIHSEEVEDVHVEEVKDGHGEEGDKGEGGHGSLVFTHFSYFSENNMADFTPFFHVRKSTGKEVYVFHVFYGKLHSRFH